MNERDSLILGAFLHDIGKFYQRTRQNPLKYKDVEEDVYGYGGAHGKWGASFVEEYIPPVFRDDNLINCILKHHKPTKVLETYVHRADCLSAGMDRTKAEERGDPYTTPLYCLLENISLKDRGKRSKYSHKLQKLSLEKDKIFPVETHKNTIDSSSYNNLWNKFTEDIEKIIKKDNFSDYFFTLYYIMEKYTWCIPGAVYVSIPDIPLFHHLKTTAAIATCLYDTRGKEEFILLEGDISGIQDFIYQINSPQDSMKDTAKRLRGRSFYLSLMNETFGDYCLNALNLTVVNKLWSGGGHFAILAPSTEENRRNIEEIEDKINSFLFKNYQGDLGFILGIVEFSSDKLKDFSSLLKEMGKVLDRKKKEKFFRQITEEDLIFPLKKHVCPVCGKDYEENSDICFLCEDHKELGEKLPKYKYIYKINSTEPVNSIIKFEDFYTYWDFKPEGKLVTGYSINNTEFLEKPEDFNRAGFIFSGNHVPGTEYGTIKTFDEMADSSEGANFLGVLRMDVDNLGMLFTLGLGEDRPEDVSQSRKSISRIASMSFSLDLFFSGYLNKICEDFENLYITYSGGDDLFIAGAWNEILDVAKRINDEFYCYTGKNPELHASGGIYLCKGKYPIKRAAEHAADALENAKKETDKNSLNIFTCNVSWYKMNEVYSFAEKLLTYLEDNKITRTFIYNTLHLDEKDRTLSIPLMSKFLYSLKRNIKDEAVQQELKNMFSSLWAFAPVWAGISMLKTRK